MLLIALLFLCIPATIISTRPEQEYRSIIEECMAMDENVEQTTRAGTQEFPEPLIISLGFNCTPSVMLNKFGLRILSFPLDWVRSSFAGVCSLIENNFVDFLNPCYLTPIRDDGSYILNTKYIVVFFHDFPTWRDTNGIDYVIDNYTDALEDVSSKYTRRIERFYNAMNSGRTIYLFRTSTPKFWPLDTGLQTKQDVARLRDVLLKKFPNAHFTLVVLSPNPQYRARWHMPHVKNFYLKNDGSEQEWNAILHQLGLIR